jgi:hypothetical protein
MKDTVDIIFTIGLLLILLVATSLYLGGCASPMPKMPTPNTQKGINCIRRCQGTHNICLIQCKGVKSAHFARCVSICNQKLKDCYQLCIQEENLKKVEPTREGREGIK